MTKQEVYQLTEAEMMKLTKKQLLEVFSMFGTVELLRKTISKADLVFTIRDMIGNEKRTETFNRKLLGR